MRPRKFDVIVLGAGFAGSLTAMILQRLGQRVALIDKSRHPRFAIGESSTPIANMVLRDLATRYDLPRLLPLTKYGSWRDAHPELGCGLKRGFSYFAHQPSHIFRPSATHENELLVAASSNDRDGDTQWLRADIDAFFCREASHLGVVVLEDCDVRNIRHCDVGDWSIDCLHDEKNLTLTTGFVVDATGATGLLPRSLGIADNRDSLRTRSRAIFSHFHHVGSWDQTLKSLAAKTADHPFHCDHAAQHHILDGAWMWMLRFDEGLTSVGIVLDESRHPIDPSRDATTEWNHWLDRYPSIAQMFDNATISKLPGKLIRTERLQRRWEHSAGDDWALLPHTAGFIDPLHSTGIAHSLCGVERLVQILARPQNTASRANELRLYSRRVLRELDLIDELVATCFASFGRFDLLTAAAMLYFAAATTYERLRHDGETFMGFLCAEQQEIRQMLRSACSEVLRAANAGDETPASDVHSTVAQLIEPINHVGLLNSNLANMYRHTVAPE